VFELVFLSPLTLIASRRMEMQRTSTSACASWKFACATFKATGGSAGRLKTVSSCCPWGRAACPTRPSSRSNVRNLLICLSAHFWLATFSPRSLISPLLVFELRSMHCQPLYFGEFCGLDPPLCSFGRAQSAGHLKFSLSRHQHYKVTEPKFELHLWLLSRENSSSARAVRATQS